MKQLWCVILQSLVCSSTEEHAFLKAALFQLPGWTRRTPDRTKKTGISVCGVYPAFHLMTAGIGSNTPVPRDPAGEAAQKILPVSPGKAHIHQHEEGQRTKSRNEAGQTIGTKISGSSKYQ
ncbi:hypothetical protein AOLI_G00110000 [Acnodon oligacanthus]